MDRRAVSFLLVGFASGVLLSAALFAWYLNGADNTAADRRTVLKLAHGLDQNHPVHKAMVFMAARLDALSAGTLAIDIFPNGQLGNETEVIEQLQRGVLAMTKTSTAPLTSFVPRMAVFDVPYAFRDAAHHWRVLHGPIGRELLLAGQAQGLRGLCYYDAGARSFYTIDKPVRTPADLVGLKIRVQKSQTAMDMVAALGGAPTPIPWGELYTALQQGMVDGAENNLPSFHTNRHYEVCKHYTFDEHTYVPDILMISTKVWHALARRQQQWVQQAANDSAEHERTLWAEATEAARQDAVEQGVTLYTPDKQPFIDAVQPMHRSYDGTEVGRLLQRIKEVR